MRIISFRNACGLIDLLVFEAMALWLRLGAVDCFHVAQITFMNLAKAKTFCLFARSFVRVFVGCLFVCF